MAWGCRWRIAALAAVAGLLMSCGNGAAPAEGVRAADPERAEPAAPPVPSTIPVVVFLGDSLTAGLGIAADETYPDRLRRRLGAAGLEVRVINAGVSGDTTAGGLTRLDWLLGQRPDVVVVELGANDGLRGLSLEQTESNLRTIIDRSQRSGARVLLVGMMLPPNYGPDYTRGFVEIYPRLARELAVPLVPFLLEGVAGRPDLNQDDGIHPTAAGHEIMAETVRPYLEELLQADG